MITFSSKPSKFSKYLPVSLVVSKFSAPRIVVSSLLVNTASILQGILQSNIVNMKATPIPLSAPRVVPFACKYPSFSITSIDSLVKSKSLLLTHTISVCACNIKGLASLVFFLIKTLL